MPVDAAALRRLLEQVAKFYVTDKAMLGAQRAVESALHDGHADDRATRAYLAAVRKYFTGFEREARGQLRSVDARLQHANQVVFNLTAERGVAVKRIEATQGVIDELRALEEHASG